MPDKSFVASADGRSLERTDLVVSRLKTHVVVFGGRRLTLLLRPDPDGTPIELHEFG